MTPGEHNMRALRQTNAKGAAFAVLAVMLHALDFRTLTARMSRDTIHDLTGLDPKTIKRALASLRASGDLQAVSYATGGRNRTPVYRFPHAHTLETGGDMPPLLPDDETQKGGHLVPKGGARDPPLHLIV